MRPSFLIMATACMPSPIGTKLFRSSCRLFVGAGAGAILYNSFISLRLAGIVDVLCMCQNIANVLLYTGYGLHNGVLDTQTSCCNMGVYIFCIIAGQKLKASRTEQRAANKQC